MKEKELMRALLKEANGSGANRQVFRAGQSAVPQKDTMAEKGRKKKKLKKPSNAKESINSKTAFRLLEVGAVPAADSLEGPKVTCVLITAGLGNRKDLNYYSPEAIQNGVPLFEGKPCFLDHMAESETVERPERSVKEKCGYFKNVRAENIDGGIGLIAELHFDLSESGKMAYQKALTAIHYKGEFPNSESEYIGLSINANGRREKRTVRIGDETLEVNYVTEFTDVGSIDEVTTPARGGRFLAALVESAAGAILGKKETQTMIVKRLKAALSALTEASKDKDLSDETKAKLTESSKSIDALLKEAMKCAKESKEEAEEESEEECSKESEESEESEDEDGEDGDGEKPAAAGVKPGHKVTKTVTVKHDGPSDDDSSDDDEDANESHRGYIKSLLKEAGVPKKLWNLDRLCSLKLKEAKAEIAEKKALLESVKDAIKEQEFVPVETGGSSFEESEDRSNMNGVFAGLSD